MPAPRWTGQPTRSRRRAPSPPRPAGTTRRTSGPTSTSRSPTSPRRVLHGAVVQLPGNGAPRVPALRRRRRLHLHRQAQPAGADHPDPDLRVDRPVRVPPGGGEPGARRRRRRRPAARASRHRGLLVRRLHQGRGRAVPAGRGPRQARPGGDVGEEPLRGDARRRPRPHRRCGDVLVLRVGRATLPRRIRPRPRRRRLRAGARRPGRRRLEVAAGQRARRDRRPRARRLPRRPGPDRRHDRHRGLPGRGAAARRA